MPLTKGNLTLRPAQQEASIISAELTLACLSQTFKQPALEMALSHAASGSSQTIN
jgi:hypothetical protein